MQYSSLFESILCTCYGVDAEDVREAIRKHNLKRVEDVTRHTRAGGGCESCHPDIQKMLDAWKRELSSLPGEERP